VRLARRKASLASSTTSTFRNAALSSPNGAARGAGIGSGSGALDQAGAHGIEANTSAAGARLILIHGKGGETAPPKMAGPRIALVDLARVTRRRHTDGGGQGRGPARRGDQVDVVGRQTIGPHLHVRGRESLRRQTNIGRMVGGAEKGVAPPVAALGDMVRRFGDDHARCSGQGDGRQLGRPSCSRNVPALSSVSRERAL
jgi:hypothetical protein